MDGLCPGVGELGPDGCYFQCVGARLSMILRTLRNVECTGVKKHRLNATGEDMVGVNVIAVPVIAVPVMIEVHVFVVHVFVVLWSGTM